MMCWYGFKSQKYTNHLIKYMGQLSIQVGLRFDDIGLITSPAQQRKQSMSSGEMKSKKRMVICLTFIVWLRWTCRTEMMFLGCRHMWFGLIDIRVEVIMPQVISSFLYCVIQRLFFSHGMEADSVLQSTSRDGVGRLNEQGIVACILSVSDRSYSNLSCQCHGWIAVG